MANAMEAKRTVAVEERDGALFLGEQKYKTPLGALGSLSLAVRDLTIHWRADYDLEDNRIGRGAYAVSGTARSKGERLGVIGDPNNRTQELSLSLYSADLTNWKTGEGRIGHTVVLGFSKADREIRSEDKWWIEIYFPSETIDRIVTALRADVLESLTLGVKFAENNVYLEPRQNFGRMAWEVLELYLRPNKETGDIDNPECAFGYEASVHLVEKCRTVSASTNADKQEPEESESERAQLQVEPDAGDADIRALTATIKVFGWTFVVLAILALIFK